MADPRVPRNCYCGGLSPIWTSRTPRTYGNRFFGCCRGKETGHCEFFIWIDPPTPRTMDPNPQSYPIVANQIDRSFWSVLLLSGMLANRVQHGTTDMEAEIRRLRTDIGHIRATRNMLCGVIAILCSFVFYVCFGYI
ncbi:hypothetical protein M0R45_015614 [Rubus argutus]|uniref:GRF-type domain-containing protein n=1 Tax=Rubus argutus TaxID=59490 RepID=A0AAW1XQP2_RUBAR